VELHAGRVRVECGPALRRSPGGVGTRETTGDVVVMDNLGSHKGAGVRAAIEAASAKLLYLPLYSPGFNRIENVVPASPHSPFPAFVAEAAQCFRIPAAWIRAVMRAESFGEVRATSPIARNLGRFLPEIPPHGALR
jgi:hypothetical protein